jgi:hypothetical protein
MGEIGYSSLKDRVIFIYHAFQEARNMVLFILGGPKPASAEN